MSVKVKFSNFKKELREVIENENYCNLEVNTYSACDLYASGYIRRKIASFLHLNNFSVKDIEKYYTDDCNDVCTHYLGEIPAVGFQLQVKDFIYSLKYNAVIFTLATELTVFIAHLKGEDININ
ncbi:MAG TPA: hypothetical protein PK536_12190 [Ignavibacteria bacterium]|nr:hypothetical protein [Bacteroidota bacterium]HRI86195.1 hypothetical protein [Ignavibacteria bacterium]HRK00471.1 hypothetical protein [Ignavibacteria bacterium]